MMNGVFGIAFAMMASVVLAASGPDESNLWTDYKHLRTSCDVSDCVRGGCLYENCKTPVSCAGGLCYFRRCDVAICGGGACLFDHVASPSCPGGACRFQNQAATLQEGYCDGGACTLEEKKHPTSFADILSS